MTTKEPEVENEPKYKSSAVVLRSQPDLAAALTESTAFSRAISGTPVPEGDTGSAPSDQSPRQSRLALDAAAGPVFSGACSALMDIDMLLYIIETIDY
jgi:hypothetical protein